VNDIKKTNDTNETIAKNIKEITRQIQNAFPETKIYLQSLYPVNQGTFDAYKISRKRISEINTLLHSYCINTNITYIDMFSRLIDETGRLRKEFTIEGLHLNATGYKFVAEILRPYVE
jgi:lysophospholipase L1-like esterase